EQAKSQLAAVRKAAVGVQDALAEARIAELEGLVATRTGDAAGATAAWGRSIPADGAKGYWAEAARVACALVEHQASQTADVAARKTKAEALFQKAGDPVGPAHVLISEGLGRARAKDTTGALTAFQAAVKAA